MPIDTLTTDYGVCVSVTGRYGTLFLASVYCQHLAALEPYTAYLDTVLLLARRTPTIRGLDANAVSPMWFSKSPDNSRDRLNREREQVMNAWIIASGVSVFNRKRISRSDIDVIFANEAERVWAIHEWRVDFRELSDHNIITVEVTPDPSSTVGNGSSPMQVGDDLV